MKILTKWNLLLLLIIFSAVITINNRKSLKKEYRYKVIGYIHYKGQIKDAVWYTNSLVKGDNFVRYKNTDGTEVVIPQPYVIIDYKYDSIIKDCDQFLP